MPIPGGSPSQTPLHARALPDLRASLRSGTQSPSLLWAVLPGLFGTMALVTFNGDHKDTPFSLPLWSQTDAWWCHSLTCDLGREPLRASAVWSEKQVQ